jgi:hypothetical protein
MTDKSPSALLILPSWFKSCIAGGLAFYVKKLADDLNIKM